MAKQSDHLLRCVISLVLLFQSSALLANWRESVPDARLSGSGEMRMFGFSIYNAQFFSPRVLAGKPPGAEVPFALALTYTRAISREDLVEASLKEIRRLSPNPLSPEQIARWDKEMQLAFVDVVPGSRITGVYVPGRARVFTSAISCNMWSTMRRSPRLFLRSGSTHAHVTRNCEPNCWAHPSLKPQRKCHVEDRVNAALHLLGQLQ